MYRTCLRHVHPTVRTLSDTSMFRTAQARVFPHGLPCETGRRISPSPPHKTLDFVMVSSVFAVYMQNSRPEAKRSGAGVLFTARFPAYRFK